MEDMLKRMGICMKQAELHTFMNLFPERKVGSREEGREERRGGEEGKGGGERTGGSTVWA